VAGGGIFAAMLNMMVWETFDSIINHQFFFLFDAF
jgi:hypothetical protein